MTVSVDERVYTSKNGITIYNPGYGPTFGADVPSIPDYMISRYGWKIVKHNGKNCWESMSELDYREKIGQLLGLDPMQVDLSLTECGDPGDTGCDGSCGTRGFCVSGGSGDNKFCFCVGILPQEK